MHQPGPPATIESTDELRDRLAHSAYIQYQVSPGLKGARAGHIWAAANATATTVTGDPLLILGDAQDAVDLLLTLLDRWPTTLTIRPKVVTLPRNAHLLLPAGLAAEHVNHWAYRWLTAEPPLATEEDRVLELREADARLRDFLRAHNPTYDIAPGSLGVVRWAGIEDDEGDLVACGAHERTEFTGLPYLGSITTASSHRGAGLGTAVTAWLSRRAVTESGVCTLSHRSDNTTASRLYTRLGYQLDDDYTTFNLNTSQWDEAQ